MSLRILRLATCAQAMVVAICCATASYAQPRINEIVAANTQGLADEDGETSDWIELANTGSTVVSLAGWALTDDPSDTSPWRFPAIDLGPGEYLVVFASGKDRTPTDGSPLHTDFSLDRGGDYLALTSPLGVTEPQNEFNPAYPEQRDGLSYGRSSGGEPGFLEPPTPGASNDAASVYAGLLSPPDFSATRGFYDGPVTLALTPQDEGAEVWYTGDGRAPTPETATRYTGPLTLGRSRVIRAAAFRDGYASSRVRTHTFLVGEDPALRDLPVVSIVGDPGEALYEPNGVMAIVGGAYTEGLDPEWMPVDPGDYNNPILRGDETERVVSAEFINVPGANDMQTDTGIRIHGSQYHRERYRRGEDWTQCEKPDRYNKFSFRFYFRDEYGDAWIDSDLFPRSTLSRTKRIVLRGGNNDSCNPFIVDELARRLHRDMGAVEVDGSFAILFINGEYKGYFNPTERVDENYLQELNGTDTKWDVLSHRVQVADEAREGDTIAWDAMVKFAKDNLIGEDPAYATMNGILDVEAFIDYIIIQTWMGNLDWPQNNWVAARERTDTGRFKFYVWDAELGMNELSLGWNCFTQPSGGLNGQGLPLATLWQGLRQNPNFRQLFADRVEEHFFGDGALTEANVIARFEELREEVSAVIPDMDTYIRDVFVPQRRAIILAQYQEQGLYVPTTPTFAVNGADSAGGRVEEGSTLTISTPDGGGIIGFTLDGSDPRSPDSWATETTTLVPEGTAFRYRVPLALDQAVGGLAPFEVIQVKAVGEVDHYRQQSGADFTAAEALYTRPNLWDGSTRGNYDTINFRGTGPDGRYPGDATFPGGGEDNFALFTSAKILIPMAGPWTFGVNSDEGFELRVGDLTKRFDGLRTPSDTLAAYNFEEAGVYDLFLGYFDHEGGEALELFAAPGSRDVFIPESFRLVGDFNNSGLGVVTTWVDIDYDDDAWPIGTGILGYESASGYEELIDTDVSEMVGTATSCFMRIPFNVDAQTLSQFTFLILRMRADDGFAAYLNGTLVAEKNSPDNPQWDAAATATTPDVEAVVQETFDVSRFIGSLVPGENVLAIQGMNDVAGGADFLLAPELVGGYGVTTPGPVSSGATEYTGPLTITQNIRIRARAFENGVWSPINEAVFTIGGGETCVRFTEIMYNPEPDGVEFLELQNTCDELVDLSGARFEDGIDFTFPAGTVLPPGGILVVTESEAAFRARYPGVAIGGVYTGSLANEGETITLVNSEGTVLETVTYRDGGDWPPAADGNGFSLTRRDFLGDPNLPETWRASAVAGGTPGAMNEPVPNIPAVLVNEALTHTDPPDVDAIEIHNPTNQTADIRGWYLTDDRGEARRARIPDQARYVIPAGGYAVIDENSFRLNPGTDGTDDLPGFALSSHGEEVYLFSADETGALTGYADGFSFDAAALGVSFGRYVLSTGEVAYPPQAFKTLGAANLSPRVGPLVITEINYNPDVESVEYVEVTNTSNASVNLFDDASGGDPSNTVEINGIGFAFPAGTALAAGEAVLVVNADPATLDDDKDLGVRVFGPFGNATNDGTANLDNGGETIRVLRPDRPDGVFVPYIEVDIVDYDDAAPWPDADGNGQVLRRSDTSGYGADPVFWTAAPPSYDFENEEEGEEEGEGEGEDLEDLREDLREAFDALDANGDGALSFTEARVGIPGLTGSQFDQLDSNSDGSLSAAELGVTTPPVGCNCNTAKDVVMDPMKYVGDFLLLAMAFLVLLATSVWTHRN